ncbi:hypothetical protein FISHEDRAFT_11391, partial [Fistulina hepatica ATCC 64428]
FHVLQPPPPKRRKLNMPVRVANAAKKVEQMKTLTSALHDLERLFKSKKTQFVSGREGLQAKRANAIRSYLLMVTKNGRGQVDASKRAAEAEGLARVWGGRMVRRWARIWIERRELPLSQKGRYPKIWSLLDDPIVRAELRSYLRSNKWSMDPTKLQKYSQEKMVPLAARKYLETILHDEMPAGLKKYMEVELFPRIHLWPGKRGISITTCCHFLHAEGFNYVETAKGVYYDGHERPDVVEYLVYILELLQPKNYDGYWNGELFCKQLKEKIIPMFERLHGPGYCMDFIVDHSQGHSAYAPDALLTTHMNLNPGGKQSRLRDGWYIGLDGARISQSMVFPNDHPDSVKRYLREHCDYTFEGLKAHLNAALASVPVATIRKWEH